MSDKTKKPGYKSTEFWHTVLQAVLGAVITITGLFLHDNHMVMMVLTGIGSLLGLGSANSYNKARAMTKASENALEAAKEAGKAADPLG